MKGRTCWQETPHRPYLEDACGPDICRVAPGADFVCLQWQDGDFSGEYLVEWREMFANAAWTGARARGNVLRVDGLAPFREYEARVSRAGGAPGKARLFRCAPVPGRVINYLHPQDNRYAFSGHALCSPSLVKMPSGTLVAGMDVFAGRAPQNLTLIFRSMDGGETWAYACELTPLFWGNLFAHNGLLYAMGTTSEFGDLVIGVSKDEGLTWSLPSHIFYGASTVGQGWQQATMPVLRHAGRLYFAVEYTGGGLPTGACVASAPEDADLLDPSVWRMTRPVLANPAWPGAPVGEVRSIAEGSLIADRAGEIKCVMRVNISGHDPTDGHAAVLTVNPNDPEAPMAFDRYIAMPSGYNSKTYIAFDPVSNLYIAVGNVCAEKTPAMQRNVLSLMQSGDARAWRVSAHLLDYRRERPEFVGFQYPSFVLDGDDMLLQSRTALNGAYNFHDANYSTFHRIRNFRKLLLP